MRKVALLLGFLALTFSFLLPGHYVPWTSFEQQACAALGGLCIAAAALPIGRDRVLGVPNLAGWTLCVAIVPWLQWRFGMIAFLSDALLSSFYLIALAAGVIVGANLGAARGDALLDGLSAVFVGTGIVSVGLGLLQLFGLQWNVFVVDLAPGGRPYANLAQPNHLSTLLSLGVVSVLWLFERRVVAGAVAVLAVAWFGLGIVMTQSRTGWLFVLLISLWWEARHVRAGLRVRRGAVWGAALAFAAAVLVWQPLNRLMLLDAGDFADRLRAGTRWVHWQTIWDAVWRAPWTGYGWQQVGLAQQAAALDHPATGEWLVNSHNLVLDLLVWNGVPLGALLVVLLSIWLIRHVRRCRSAQQWVLLAAVGTLLTHALLEYPLEYTYFLLALGLLMGLLEADDVGKSSLRLPFPAAAATLLSMTALLVFVCLEYLQVQTAARQLRFAMAGIGDGTVPPPVPPPDVVLLDAPREFHRFWLISASRGMSNTQFDWMQQVTQRYPVPPALLRYALAAGLNGRAPEADRALRLLCKMHSGLRCDEGRASWIELQKAYPELKAIAAPPAASTDSFHRLPHP